MKAKSDDKNLTPEAQLRSWIDKLDPKAAKLFRSVRTAVRKRFPTANELAYNYGFSVVTGYSPTLNGIEAIVSISARDTGVALYFNFGPQLPDPKGILKGSGKATRFIEVDKVSRLSHPDVKALIAAAEGLSKIPMPATGKGIIVVKGAAAKKKSRPKRR